MDVVVPFRGRAADLEELREHLARLRLGPRDSVLIVDNTPGRAASYASGDGRVPILHAVDRKTPGFARNRGAARGRAAWLVFLDADVVPLAGLLDRYFDPPPAERTALVAGGVMDEEVPPDASAAQRHSYVSQAMSQDNTFGYGTWSFPQTANVACRRRAFEEVGGFREDIRAGEDADLAFRLRAAGWEIERREPAAVVHRSRRSVSGYLRQKALHGAGAGWVASRYPGAFPPRRRPGLVWWAARTAVKGVLAAAPSRNRDLALRSVLEPLAQLAFEFGRSLPNERPWPRRRQR